jgi:hypothetical protein
MIRRFPRATQVILAAALAIGIGAECGQAVGQRLVNELNRITGGQRTNRPTRTLTVVGSVGLNGFNRTLDSVDVLVDGRELRPVEYNVTRVPDPGAFDEQYNYTSKVPLHDNGRLILQTRATLRDHEGEAAGTVDSQFVNVMPAH